MNGRRDSLWLHLGLSLIAMVSGALIIYGAMRATIRGEDGGAVGLAGAFLFLAGLVWGGVILWDAIATRRHGCPADE